MTARSTARCRAGIGYRHAYRDALLAVDESSQQAAVDKSSHARDPSSQPPLLEIMPDHFFGDPALERLLDQLAERYPIVFHDVGMSLATAGDAAFARERLQMIARLAKRVRPVLFGEHLALTRSPSGIDLGHLAPVWMTREILGIVVDRVRALQDVLGVPVVVENIAAPFTIPGGDFSEPELFGELVERTGCGMLLDVTNLLYNARNTTNGPPEDERRDVAALLAQYPLEAVQQIHLAGGVARRASGGRGGSRPLWIDSHSEPVEDATFALLALIRQSARSVRAIVVERDARLPPIEELVAEARRAIAVFDNVSAKTEETDPC